MWRTRFLIDALLLVQMNSLNGGGQEYVYIYINYSLKQMIKKKKTQTHHTANTNGIQQRWCGGMSDLDLEEYVGVYLHLKFAVFLVYFFFFFFSPRSLFLLESCNRIGSGLVLVVRKWNIFCLTSSVLPPSDCT